MKIVKLVIVSSFLAIIICIGGLFAYNLTNKVHKFKGIKDTQLITIDNNKPKRDKTRFKNFAGLKMEKASLALKYEGRALDISLPIYIQKNRYYLPLTELIDELDANMEIKDNLYTIKFNNKIVEIDTISNTFKTGTLVNKLREKLVTLDNVTYVSLFDFTRIFDLKPRWQYDNNSILLFNNRENLSSKDIPKTQKIALLRLEDISSGETERYATAEALYKLRIISDFLFSKGVPFHIAWIPRFVDASNGRNIDHDLTKENSIHNADFLYTLDYLEENGGIVGLHGYTHQYGNEKSAEGTEFGNRKDKHTFSDEYALNRINNAKETANYLEVPFRFFEAPHYSITLNQMKVLENNFDLLYEPYSTDGLTGNTYVTAKKVGNRLVRYIPTPLNYLDGKPDLPNMFRRINALKPDMMASFFFHPPIEFDDIKISKGADGYPSYAYSEKSALHQIINTIENKGYSFKRVTDLN